MNYLLDTNVVSELRKIGDGKVFISDIGKVMGAVMPQVKGRTTGDAVGQMARELLEKK